MLIEKEASTGNQPHGYSLGYRTFDRIIISPLQNKNFLFFQAQFLGNSCTRRTGSDYYGIKFFVFFFTFNGTGKAKDQKYLLHNILSGQKNKFKD